MNIGVIDAVGSDGIQWTIAGLLILLTLLSFKSPRLGCHPDYEHRRLLERQGQEVSDKWVEGD